FEFEETPQLLASGAAVDGLERGELEQAVRQGAALCRAALDGSACSARPFLQPQLVEELVPPRAAARVGELGDRREHGPVPLLSVVALDAGHQLSRAFHGGCRIRTG